MVDLRHLPAWPARLQRTVAAPQSWQSWGSVVPAGSSVDVDVEFASTADAVVVTGRAGVPVVTECSRCLDPIATTVVVDLDQRYRRPGHEHGPDVEAVDDEPEVEGDLLDLEPALRDAVLTGLPLVPLCRDDCPGLCAECGVRLDEHPGHRHETIDPRWAALAGYADGPTGERPPDDEEGH